MKCPHCNIVVHQSWQLSADLGGYSDGNWSTFSMRCPECNRLILELRGQAQNDEQVTLLVYPRAGARPPLPTEVPAGFASDYREAVNVLEGSPKASAALSRRCLQNLLREKAGVTPANLYDEIGEAMKSLPTHLADAVDAIRNIGNFAAHPIKSTSTGEVVDVEPGEAEWLLDTLEGLFDFYFVQPELLRGKRDALNQKLQDAGKAPMQATAP